MFYRFWRFFLIYKSAVFYEQMILAVLSCLFSNEVVMVCRRIFFVQIAISNLKIFWIIFVPFLAASQVCPRSTDQSVSDIYRRCLKAFRTRCDESHPLPPISKVSSQRSSLGKLLLGNFSLCPYSLKIINYFHSITSFIIIH